MDRISGQPRGEAEQYGLRSCKCNNDDDNDDAINLEPPPSFQWGGVGAQSRGVFMCVICTPLTDLRIDKVNTNLEKAFTSLLMHTRWTKEWGEQNEMESANREVEEYQDKQRYVEV